MGEIGEMEHFMVEALEIFACFPIVEELDLVKNKIRYKLYSKTSPPLPLLTVLKNKYEELE